MDKSKSILNDGKALFSRKETLRITSCALQFFGNLRHIGIARLWLFS